MWAFERRRSRGVETPALGGSIAFAQCCARSRRKQRNLASGMACPVTEWQSRAPSSPVDARRRQAGSFGRSITPPASHDCAIGVAIGRAVALCGQIVTDVPARFRDFCGHAQRPSRLAERPEPICAAAILDGIGPSSERGAARRTRPPRGYGLSLAL